LIPPKIFYSILWCKKETTLPKRIKIVKTMHSILL